VIRPTVRGAVVLVGVLLAGVPAVPAAARAADPVPSVETPAADFYDVPDPLPPGEPGDVIKVETVAAPQLRGTLLRVMYHSRSVAGADIAVTGTIAVPAAAAPAGGRPVLSWGHGTVGIADVCAPSKYPGGSIMIDFGNQILDAGYIMASTDYEGLGTPGRHPYIVGESEARGVIDIVRAARNLAEAEASTEWLVWGHSQGGHAALFAGQLAESWAPELDLVGTVAGAPPSQLNLVYQALKGSRYRYYLLMAGVGMEAAYDTVDLTDVVTPLGMSKIDVVDTGCTQEIFDAYKDDATDDLVKADPYTIPAWRELIDEQEPGTVRTDVPILIIHGGNDEQIPVVSSQLLLDRMCGLDQVVVRRVYPDRSHSGVIAPSFPAMLEWIDDRFEGQPAPNDCDDVPPPTSGPTTSAPAKPRPPAATPIAARARFTG
jgi:fermentation-respiration switch protein FrsA (DUF1100 family)